MDIGPRAVDSDFMTLTSKCVQSSSNSGRGPDQFKVKDAKECSVSADAFRGFSCCGVRIEFQIRSGIQLGVRLESRDFSVIERRQFRSSRMFPRLQSYVSNMFITAGVTLYGPPRMVLQKCETSSRIS